METTGSVSSQQESIIFIFNVPRWLVKPDFNELQYLHFIQQTFADRQSICLT